MREIRERRRGYHRPRVLPRPESFILADHHFETDGKDLWVTAPRVERIDRIKVTRFVSSQSMRRGYPTELVRPEPLTRDFARSAADFWIGWSQTADYARFPEVHLDCYVRQQEAKQLTFV